MGALKDDDMCTIWQMARDLFAQFRWGYWIEGRQDDHV